MIKQVHPTEEKFTLKNKLPAQFETSMFRSLFISYSPLSRSVFLKNRINKGKAIISQRVALLRAQVRSFYTTPIMCSPCSTDPEYDCMVEKVKEKILSFPDFPKKGILFWDIFSALRDGPTCTLLHKLLVKKIRTEFPDVQAVVGLEARGFLFAFSIAQEMGIGCLPVRKKGKLPGEVVSHTYTLEYGSDTFQIQKNAVTCGLKCVILDDLIATGGSMAAATKLLQDSGAKVLGGLVIIELTSLQGKKNLPCDVQLHSMIKYE